MEKSRIKIEELEALILSKREAVVQHQKEVSILFEELALLEKEYYNRIGQRLGG